MTGPVPLQPQTAVKTVLIGETGRSVGKPFKNLDQDRPSAPNEFLRRFRNDLIETVPVVAVLEEPRQGSQISLII